MQRNKYDKIKKNTKALLFIFFLAMGYDVHSISPEYIIANQNYLTPPLEPDQYAKPQNFSKISRLNHKPGSAFKAIGKEIVLDGFVTDVQGNAISCLKMSIWQANSNGFYQYLITEEDVEKFYDKDFESTGSTLTGNDGYFYFETILPGSYGNSAPHIHFELKCNKKIILESEIFFQYHPKNDTDPKLKNLKPKKKDLLIAKLKKVEELVTSEKDPLKIETGVLRFRINLRADILFEGSCC